MISFKCPHCGESVSLDESLASRRARCPLCNAIVQVPPASEDAQEAPRPRPQEVGAKTATGAGVDDDGELELDEEDLAYAQSRAADETDILPAIEAELGDRFTRMHLQDAKRRVGRGSKSTGGTQASRRTSRSLAIVLIIVTLIAVVVILFATGMIKFPPW